MRTTIVVTVLRMLVGWHFLYEGLAKLVQPGGWSAAGYLRMSKWFAAPLFHHIAETPALLRACDLLNMWGLTMIGLALILGVLVRPAAICGILLLAFYYIAHPPFLAWAAEGHFLWIDRNVVEAAALAVVALLPSADLGAWLAARLRARGSSASGAKDPARGKTPNSKEVAREKDGSCEGKEFLGQAVDASPNPRPAFPPSRSFSLALPWSLEFLTSCFRRRSAPLAPADPDPGRTVFAPGRRELLLRLGSLPVLGAFGFAFIRKHGPVWERENLKDRVDTVTTATVKAFDFADIKDLKKPVDKFGKIGNLKLSRMFLGGNLIGGWAHARDLLYADKLVKAYFTDDRVFRTFRMAEACGMNTILTNPALMRVINDYWKKEGGKIQFISDCGHKDGLIRGAEVSVENGASAVYTHGGRSDQLAAGGAFGEIAKALDAMRKLGVPAGIGAHRLETVKGCVEHGIIPDFWMKTLHHTKYWSAHPEAGYYSHDNVWCLDADDVVAYMETLEQPWIAFKILAAGAIEPREAFPYAFRSGADFICVGMYDFQIVDDVNLVTSILDAPIDRKRPWRA